MDADPQSSRVLEVSLRKAGYKVTTAADAGRAHALLSAELPDLLLLDPAVDSGGGLALLASLRADDATQSLPVMLLCGEGAADLRARAVAIGIDDYVQKPLFVREVLARVELVLSRRERESLAHEQRSQMSGSLASLGFVDLLQTIDVSQKSGVLTLQSRGRTGSVLFRDGRVVDADSGQHRGEHALYRFLSWNDGEFELVFRPVRNDDQLGVSTQGLLMEGMRRLDAWGVFCEALPPLGNVLEVDGAALSERWSDVRDEDNGVLGLFDGMRSIEDVIDASPGDDLAAISAIEQLYSQGFLVPRAARDPRTSQLDASVDQRENSPSQRESSPQRPSTETLRPEGMLAAPSAPGRTAPGVRIGGVQLRRVLASALGERPSAADVANAQGGPLRAPAVERTVDQRNPSDGLKTGGLAGDVQGVRGDLSAQEEAESPMSKRAKKRTSRAPGAPTLVSPVSSEPANVIPISVARAEQREEVASPEPVAARPRRRAGETDEELGRATQPAFVDDDEHPEISQFFSASQARDTWAESTRLPPAHEADEPDHDDHVPHGSSKRWAVAISLIGAALIGGFLVYHKVVMPTPTEFEPAKVALPTPDMMRGIPDYADSEPEQVREIAPTAAVAQPDDLAPPRADGAGTSAMPVLEAAPPASPAVAVDTADAASQAAYLAAVDKAQKLKFKKTAENAYLEALAITPNGSEALSGLAILYLNQGKNGDARERAEQALRSNQADGTAWIVLGATYSARGDAAKAREAYAKCASLPGKYASECKRMLR